ncbi:MAG: NAD-dependent epimerase/dehydratase family protein [Bauldia sp.]|nr:NAD-dependent epimerase/dehydratase family protein [Bauldia sp.]
MTEIDTSAPVLVTGATGYVAGWIVKRLLEAGATVHAAVREPANGARRVHLDEAAAAAPGSIRYFKADLIEEGSYSEAMRGCSIVFHTASPFITEVTDAEDQLIEPALLGTRNVLGEAARAPSVRRVVVTSSCAAMYSDAADCAKGPGGMLTEDVWNTTASPDYQPYSYSKTIAEKEAWRIAEGQAQFRLVTVNPSLVMGPAIGGRPTSESFALIDRAGRGEFKRGVPRFGIGIVDVRDVADGHIAAAFRENARGRHILSGHDTTLFDSLTTLLPAFGDRYPLPRRATPKWLVWLIAPRVDLTRRFVARNADVPWRADNTKSIRELGMTYRPLAETMVDMFRYMIEQGYFEPGRNGRRA